MVLIPLAVLMLAMSTKEGFEICHCYIWKSFILEDPSSIDYICVIIMFNYYPDPFLSREYVLFQQHSIGHIIDIRFACWQQIRML